MENGPNRVRQEVVFDEEAHQQLLEGASILAKAVSSTMGPSGHNVIIDSHQGAPLITKDGVTVAKSINLKKKLPYMGAELLKEVASKTNEIAGDGTTSSVVLAYAMLKEGIKMIATGRDSIYLKKGMDFATSKVISYLMKTCIPVRNSTDIVNIGTISANGDRQIGELLAMAIDKVGQDGIITIEPGKSTQTILEVVEGMQFDGGYLSPYFITNPEKNVVELENPFILLTTRKISSLPDLIPILEKVVDANRPLLIIADEVEGEALHTLIVNKFKGILQSCAVKAPSYGENRTDILADIAHVVGGSVLDTSSGTNLKNLQLEDLGFAKKVIVSRTSTTIVGEPNEDLKVLMQERVKGIKAALESNTLDDLHLDRYKKRLAKLAGGVALVKVGGSTEVEILEKKDRVEDALNATIAAAQEGIVPGGGAALYFASLMIEKELTEQASSLHLSDDEWAGVKIILSACKAPLTTIVSNTGKSPDVVMNTLQGLIRDNLSNPDNLLKIITRFGYDAAKCEYGDLIESGVIDPCKVPKFAMEFSNSVVGLLLTCNAVVTDITEND